MFKVGDKVRYTGHVGLNKPLYNGTGIIIKIGKYCNYVRYEEKCKSNNTWWLMKSHLKHVIPEYILDWKKKLNV